MSDSFALWLELAGRRPLLSEQEVTLHTRTIQSWLAGDVPQRIGKRSMDRMIESNLRLVIMVFRRKFSFISTYDRRAQDVLQDGALGLRHALLKFDPARGYKFSTYAYNWIYKYMDDSVRSAKLIRLSADCQSTVMSARRRIASYTAEHGKPPTIKWIAESLNRQPSTVKFYLDCDQTMGNVASLNNKCSGDDDKSEVIVLLEAEPEYDLEADSQGEKLNQVLQIIMSGAGLTDIEKHLISGRFLNNNGPQTWSSLERETGVKQRSAPLMVQKALKRVAKTAERYNLDIEQMLSAV